MVGVGETVISKRLGGNRKLVLHSDWESHESAIEGSVITGDLPGLGCIHYTIGIEEEEDGDLEPLQEFNFRGGGDLRSDDAPPIVKKAFNDWYEKLMNEQDQRESRPIPRVSIAIEYVGSLVTENAVDVALNSVRDFARGWSLHISEMTPETVARERRRHLAFPKLREGETGRRLTAEEGDEPKEPEVKGFFVKVHRNIEEIGVAFVDYGDCWIMAESVRMRLEDLEARDALLRLLSELKLSGAVLSIREVWYDHARKQKSVWEGDGSLFHSDAAARGENPYYPGLPAAPEGGYRFPNPTGVWKTEARMWLDSYGGKTSCVTSEDVEALYAAGAANVDITFAAGEVGCEVTPPDDVDSRRNLISAIRSKFNPEYWEAELTAEEAELKGEDYERAQRVANAKFDEVMAQKGYGGRPWIIF